MEMKKIFSLFIILSITCIKAMAYDIIVKNADGIDIYYNYINDGKELEVVSSKGNVVNIPEKVTFMNRTRKVTSIGYQAFKHCNKLTSVTIPNSVNKIGWEAFLGCKGLTSVIIPSSVTEIGGFAFHYCSGLTSVTILSRRIEIGERAFYFCSRLNSVKTPDLETWCSIIFDKYREGNDYASNPLHNANHLFINGKEIKNLLIPNSVSNIHNGAFCGCSGLTSVTIPNNVKSIGEMAFLECDIPKVISYIESPFAIENNTFSDNTFYNATLYVPVGSLEKYKATKGWNKFKFIEEGNGN